MQPSDQLILIDLNFPNIISRKRQKWSLSFHSFSLSFRCLKPSVPTSLTFTDSIHLSQRIYLVVSYDARNNHPLSLSKLHTTVYLRTEYAVIFFETGTIFVNVTYLKFMYQRVKATFKYKYDIKMASHSYLGGWPGKRLSWPSWPSSGNTSEHKNSTLIKPPRQLRSKCVEINCSPIIAPNNIMYQHRLALDKVRNKNTVYSEQSLSCP